MCNSSPNVALDPPRGPPRTVKVGGAANTATATGGGGGGEGEGNLPENQPGSVRTIELAVTLCEKARQAKKGKSALKSGAREELEAGGESKLHPKLKGKQKKKKRNQ